MSARQEELGEKSPLKPCANCGHSPTQDGEGNYLECGCHRKCTPIFPIATLVAVGVTVAAGALGAIAAATAAPGVAVLAGGVVVGAYLTTLFF